MTDNVNHPQHYEGHTSLECIDVMLIIFGPKAVAHFCLCNAFKYLWRHRHKNGLEDLKKAMWYLNKSNAIVDVFAVNLDGQYGRLLDLWHKARKEYE